jgi:hypothetical protein
MILQVATADKLKKDDKARAQIRRNQADLPWIVSLLGQDASQRTTRHYLRTESEKDRAIAERKPTPDQSRKLVARRAF